MNAVKRAFRSRASATADGGPIALITVAGEEVILDEAVFDPTRPQNIGRVSFAAKYMPSNATPEDIAAAKQLFIKVFGKLKKEGSVDPILTPGAKFPGNPDERGAVKDAIVTRIKTLAEEILRGRAARQGMISIDLAKKLDTLEVLKAIEDKIDEEEAAGVGMANTGQPPSPGEMDDQRLLKRLLALYGQRRGAAAVGAWGQNVDTLYGILQKEGWDNSQVDGSLGDWYAKQDLEPYPKSVIEAVRQLGPDVAARIYEQYVSNVRQNIPAQFAQDFDKLVADQNSVNDIAARMIAITGWIIGKINQRGGEIDAANATKAALEGQLAAAKNELAAAQEEIAKAKGETERAKADGAAGATAATEEARAAAAASLAAQQGSLAGLEEQVRALQEEKDAAAAAAAAAGAERQALQAAMAAANETIKIRDTTIQITDEKIASLTDERDSLKADNERINAQIDDLRRELGKAAGTGEAAAALQQELNTLQGESDTKQARIEELERQISAAKEEVAAGKAAEERATAAASAAEAAQAAAEQKVEEATAAAAAAAAAVEARNGELAQLRQDLAAARVAAAEVGPERDAKQAAQARIRDLEGRIQAAEDAADAIAAQAREAQAALEDEKRKLAPAVAAGAAAATAAERTRQQTQTANAITAAGQASQTEIRRLQGELRAKDGEIAAAREAFADAQAAAGSAATQAEQLRILRVEIGKLQNERGDILGILERITTDPGSAPRITDRIQRNAGGPLAALIEKMAALKAGREATVDQNICFLVYFISYYIRMFFLKNTPRDFTFKGEKRNILEMRQNIYSTINSPIVQDILSEDANGSASTLRLETVLKSLQTILEAIETTGGNEREIKQVVLADPDQTISRTIQMLISITKDSFGPTHQLHGQVRSLVQDSLSAAGMARPTVYIQTYGSSANPFFIFQNSATNLASVRAKVRGRGDIDPAIKRLFDQESSPQSPLFLTYEYCLLVFILLSREYIMRRAEETRSCGIPDYVRNIGRAFDISIEGAAAAAPAPFGFGGPGGSVQPAAPPPPPPPPPPAPPAPPASPPPPGAAAAAQRYQIATSIKPPKPLDPKAPIEIPTLETNEKTFFAIFKYLDTRGVGATLSDAIVNDLSPYISITSDKKKYIESNIQKFPVAVLLKEYGTSTAYFKFPDTIYSGSTRILVKDISSFNLLSPDMQKLALKKIIEHIYDNYGNTVKSDTPANKIRKATQSIYEFMLDLFRAYYYQYSIIGVTPENKFEAVYNIFDEIFFKNPLESTVNKAQRLPLGNVLGITPEILRAYIDLNKYPTKTPIGEPMKPIKRRSAEYPETKARAPFTIEGVVYTGGRRTRRLRRRGESSKRASRRRTKAQD